MRRARGSAKLTIIMMVVGPLFLMFGFGLIRGIDGMRRARWSKAPNELEFMRSGMDELISSGAPMPPLGPLADFVDARELKGRHGEGAKTFGKWNRAHNVDPYSSNGTPFAAETSGTLYIIYSTGPDGVYDIQPAQLRDALSRRNKGPLEDAGYLRRAAPGKGDIYVTNIELTLDRGKTLDAGEEKLLLLRAEHNQNKWAEDHPATPQK
ncbi:hypothetical protein BH09SUM1_BH09SUM1_10880 [soil metagenome]